MLAISHLRGFNARRAAAGAATYRNHGFGSDQGNGGSSTTTWVTQAEVTISSPVANKKHLLLGTGLASWVTANTQIAGVRLRNHTDSADMSYLIAGAYATGAKLGFAAMGIYDSGGSPTSHTFRVDYRRDSGGSGSITLEDAGLVWMELGADDDATETLTENSYSGAQAWVDCHTRTIDLPSGDYLVIACGDMRAATGNAHGVRLYDGTTVFGEINRECKNNTDYYSYFYADILTIASGSKTWKIQQRNNGFAFGNVRLRNMKLAFVRMDNFANYWSAVAASETSNTTTTPSVKNTLTFTPSAGSARDHLILMNMMVSKTSGSNRAQAEHREGSTQRYGMHDYANASTTSIASDPALYLAMPSLSSGSGSQTYDSRFQISATTTTAKAKCAFGLALDFLEA